MRIAVVSAHFPPNFVSGGTLQPQRLARGLRARGHDVWVYAGWLGSKREALTTFEDVDLTGLAVRWIVTTPFTDWGGRTTFDNPCVVADFADWLAKVRPDVVHLHSIQSLGAGLLPAARAAGACVVVTMHDFWWLCARQFLVDRSWQPCPLVVSCGRCACELDHEWLDDRNRWLADALGSADLVLAPSAIASQVLAANGVDVDRLEVDENGLPEHVASRGVESPTEQGRSAKVHFRYAGGPDRMKGVDVLVDAARQLGPRAGWRLTLHGAERYLTDQQIDLDDLPVDSCPAYPPDEAEAILAATDILVVPSVMRESHSILVREALTQGVPVICSDCLGPEEVVVHDGNGLVVPTGDRAALAAAMARVLDEPALLPRLRMSARTVPVRSLADQVDGLERRFQGLTGGGRRPSPQPARRVERVVFVVGIEGAPLRYRAQLPAEALALVGVSADVVHYRDPRVDALAAVADVVVMYRVPATVQVVALQDRLRAAGTPLFFDVDDLIFDPALAAEIPALRILPADQAELWLQGVHRYRTTMEGCDAFIGSTEALVAHASAVTGLPSFRFSNGVGAQVAKLSQDALAQPRSPGGPRIGYLSGTDTHDQDWAHVEPAVIANLDAHPDAELVLIGPIKTTSALDRFGPRVRRLPFQPWTGLPAHLRDLDVNLAPLEPELRFNQAKSALKWLEAALARVPTIASPTGPFQEAIDPGVNGLLADTTDEWAAALNQLLTSDVDRLRLGRRAERDALLRWSPHLQGRRYLDILTSPLPHRSTSGGWVPVVLDEPPLPQAVQLTPYLLASSANEQRAAAGTRPHRLPSLFTRGVDLLRRGMRSVREEGITRTAGRSFRFAQRRLGRRQAPH